MDDNNYEENPDESSSRHRTERKATAWVPHSVLLHELFNAIQQDGPASSADDAEYEEIYVDMFGDEDLDLEDDEEENRTLLLLSELRPRLEELFTKA